MAAPFWADADARLDGEIYYEIHRGGESSDSDELLTSVNTFIRDENQVEFEGSWMIVATWDGVHPWPHGSSPQQAELDPVLQAVSMNIAL